MKGFVTDLDQATVTNDNFRNVLFTGAHHQLVLMSLKPGEDIGLEVHDVDQFFRVEEGEGTVTMDGRKHHVSPGSGFVVPAGTRHNVINGGHRALKLYTLYSSPQHPDGAKFKTKEEAEAAELAHT